MGQIPESERSHQDIIDIIIDACQKETVLEKEDGSLTKQLMLDSERVYWKTQLINSDKFSRFVLFLKMFEGMGKQAFNRMSKQRAEVMESQIKSIVDAYKYSIDAKSSESKRDQNNTQSTLVDKIVRNRQEKIYKIPGEIKRSFADALIGRDAQQEYDSN